MYKALSLCIEGTSPDDIPLHPPTEISADITEMAVYLTEYFHAEAMIGIQSGNDLSVQEHNLLIFNS